MRRTFAALAVGLLTALPAGAASAAPTQAPGCDVVTAELTWGFKESFRAYIDGSIANGEWTVADGATYDTPDFGFPAESGRVDPRQPNGSIAFAGSVRFTGHGGILDTTVARPVVVIHPDGTGVLLLDVSGPTMEGDQVSVVEAEFLDIDLTGQNLTPVDGVIRIDAAPTTLTSDGAVAFPNYEAGTAFDPITVVADVGDCDLTGQPIGTDTTGDTDTAGEAGMPWLLPAIGVAAVAVGALVVALIVTRRRRP
ncbi:HtaA domain-containing protein [Pseudolysinimonas yzui]|uniref:Htaa domain-containing protein n=1 Tax=Pseudolysinimonas yzui TaxID=2708254 RepID=A0A8J3M2R1_9MICO|nr:HtaA domain-containing protein [Pseudolysinimonas yzui]GHF22291.1 hypothetical protein GCM10011600_24300 [Pseudolysinimonas yzui]